MKIVHVNMIGFKDGIMVGGALFGLIIGLVGSALVILPTFPTVQYYINNQDTIEKLEEGRQDLTKEGTIFKNTSSFDLVVDVIESNWDQDLSIECYGLHRPKLVFKDTASNETYNRVMTVYSVDQDAAEQDHPSAENYIQDIESILVIDSWIEKEIENLRTTRIQRVRGFGFALIVISVFIQGGVGVI